MWELLFAEMKGGCLWFSEMTVLKKIRESLQICSHGILIGRGRGRVTDHRPKNIHGSYDLLGHTNPCIDVVKA